MHRKAYFLLLVTMLFWAGNAVAGKLAIGHVSPMLLSALRWALAMVVLVVIGRRHLAADWPVLRQSRVVPEALALDLPADALDNYLYNNAEEFFFGTGEESD